MSPPTPQFYLEQLLFLRDLVVDLPASRAKEGPPRHLLERLGTASKDSHHTPEDTGGDMKGFLTNSTFDNPDREYNRIQGRKGS